MIPIPYVEETRAPLALKSDELPLFAADAAEEEAVLARVTRKPIPPTSSSLSRPSTIDPLIADDDESVGLFRAGEEEDDDEGGV